MLTPLILSEAGGIMLFWFFMEIFAVLLFMLVLSLVVYKVTRTIVGVFRRGRL